VKATETLERKRIALLGKAVNIKDTWRRVSSTLRE
jgi:hypothetical protein